MNENETKQSKITIIAPYIFSLMIILVAINYAGDYTWNKETPTETTLCYKDAECVKWLNKNYRSEAEWNKTLTSLTKTFTRQANETSLFKAATKQTLKEFKLEIVNIKDNMDKKFPAEAVGPDESQTAIAQTPFLTLSIGKSIWNLGSTLVFTGTGTPGETVILNVVKFGGCGANDHCSEWKKVNQHGNFMIEFETEFDDLAGAWKAFVRAGDLESETITFEMK